MKILFTGILLKLKLGSRAISYKTYYIELICEGLPEIKPAVSNVTPILDAVHP